jgi:hypothetical protein
MFHRQQMLVLLKKILLLAKAKGEHNPNGPENKKARYALGKLALMTNDFLNPEDQIVSLFTERMGLTIRATAILSA